MIDATGAVADGGGRLPIPDPEPGERPAVVPFTAAGLAVGNGSVTAVT